jgi:alpha-L-fucosidase 2
VTDAFLLITVTLGGLGESASAQRQTTPWDGVGFRFDVPRVIARSNVARSNVVLERPNRRPTEAMPLGNRRLGAAVCGALL